MPADIALAFRFTKGERKAIKRFVQIGYSFPADNQTGVMRKMLHETWERELPDEPFPPDDEEED